MIQSYQAFFCFNKVFFSLWRVPENIVFDNMRNVVSRFIYGGKKEYNKELIKLSNYYGFKIVTTNPRSGNEKGHVETSGKIARTELFTFNYKFESLETLRKYTVSEMLDLNKDKHKLRDEKVSLIKLPLVKYELGRLENSRVNHEALIMIDSNYYSVPDSYVGKNVYSNVYLEHINVYNLKHELISSHNKKVGKTHTAIGLGIAANMQSKNVLYITVPNLITELKESMTLNQLTNYKKRFITYDLVILDELGYIGFDKEGSELLFNLLSMRNETKSIIITTNLSFNRWEEIFGDPTLTAAMVDRIAHKATVINIKGDSYRIKETKEWLNN